jgi:hypothetical protein
MSENREQTPLIPAKAGIQRCMGLSLLFWVPAFAGMSGYNHTHH